jgi:hypothetical protein
VADALVIIVIDLWFGLSLSCKLLQVAVDSVGWLIDA